MKPFAFLFSIFIFGFILNNGYCKIARVNLDDIKEHRKRNYVELIDALGDLDRKNANVSAVFDHIQSLKNVSDDILHSVPDNGNACFIKVKYRLAQSIRRLEELCDLCIAEHLDGANTSILNDNQRKCLDGTLSSIRIEIDAVKPQAADCKSFFAF